MRDIINESHGSSCMQKVMRIIIIFFNVVYSVLYNNVAVYIIS